MFSNRRSPLGTVFILSALGCGEATPPRPVGDLHLQVTSGGEQTGVAGQELPEPVVVRVTDEHGRPVSGVLVNFVVTGGYGYVFAGAALTNATGEARERWTLGVLGENLLEARGVDQTTGAAIVYAQIHATAIPGPPARVYVPPEYRSQYRLIGQAVEIRDFVQVYDLNGHAVPDAPLVISAGPGLLIVGTSVQADPQQEVSGMVKVTVAGVSDSFTVSFLPDFTQVRWRAAYSCGSASVHVDLDSMINVVALSDSVRQELYHLGADGTYVGLDLVIYMRATATLYYRDGRVIEGAVPSHLTTNITARLFPRRIDYARVRHPWRPAAGTIQYSSAFSNGAIPPTYTGGHLCDDLFNSHTPGTLQPFQ